MKTGFRIYNFKDVARIYVNDDTIGYTSIREFIAKRFHPVMGGYVRIEITI